MTDTGLTEEMFKYYPESLLHGLDRPDRPMSRNNDKVTDVRNVKNWSHYDNYQTGEYVNENSIPHSSIMVYNSTVLINRCQIFMGDVSQRRFKYLVDLTARYSDLRIEIKSEGGCWGYFIINGTPTQWKIAEGDYESKRQQEVEAFKSYYHPKEE